MGFSLDDIVNDSASYTAPDYSFIAVVSSVAKGFPWERFEQFFEVRPLIQASAADQVFLLRIVAMQELLCLDDDGVLKWLKRQMYLFAFLSPDFKPKVPSKALLNNFREKLHEVNLLEPFRLRCEKIILKQNTKPMRSAETTNYMDEFSPENQGLPLNIEDKWVICPQCSSSALTKVTLGTAAQVPEARCDQCGHEFKV